MVWCGRSNGAFFGFACCEKKCPLFHVCMAFVIMGPKYKLKHYLAALLIYQLLFIATTWKSWKFISFIFLNELNNLFSKSDNI